MTGRQIASRVTGVALVVVLVAAGCASDRYRTQAHFDTEYDFTGIRTFAFHGQRAKIAESEYGQILESALRRGVTERGYTEVPVADADVLVSYDLGRYAPAKLSGANSFAITEGTISVSVIDPASGRTVWYGWVESRLRPHDEATVVIPAAVDALLEGRIPAASAL